MTLKEYIKQMMEIVPEGSTVNFDVGIAVVKGEIRVDKYSSNKIRFTVTKRIK